MFYCTELVHISWDVPPLFFPLRPFWHAEFDFLLAAPYLLLDLTLPWCLELAKPKSRTNQILNSSYYSSFLYLTYLATFLGPLHAWELLRKENNSLLYFHSKKKNHGGVCLEESSWWKMFHVVRAGISKAVYLQSGTLLRAAEWHLYSLGDKKIVPFKTVGELGPLLQSMVCCCWIVWHVPIWTSDKSWRK